MRTDIQTRLERLIAKNVIVREELNDPIEAQRRYSICEKCPSKVVSDTGEEKCQLCGCILSLKVATKVNYRPAKFRSEETHCPAGKWGDDDFERCNFYRVKDALLPLRFPGENIVVKL